MPEYSPLPVTYEATIPLGGSIRRVATDNAGVVKPAGFWDHEKETWDAEFDPARHVRPFQRLGADPASPEFRAQLLAVPIKPFADRSAVFVAHALGDGGLPKDVYHVQGRSEIINRCGLD